MAPETIDVEARELTDQPLPVLDPRYIPDNSTLITDDGAALDNIYAEKQQRLLTETLYSSWTSPDEKPFVALANVGLFFIYGEPPLVPDVMLSLDVSPVEDLHHPDHRSYISWVIGKMPDVVIEIVSDRRGGEETDKMQIYARQRILYYVIYDPNEHLNNGPLRVYALQGRKYRLMEPHWLAEVGLGLMFWTGSYENQPAQWLRWCDAHGQPIQTGKERADTERQRADTERQRADTEKQRADTEKQRADTAEERIRLLEERLRALGQSKDH